MKISTLLILVLLAIGIAACNSDAKSTTQQEYVVTGTAQGSTYALKYLAADELVRKEAIDSIFVAIDNSMSTWVPTSIISRINKGDSTVVIDDHFRKVFEASEAIYKSSKELFDPTVGSLMKLYGYGKEKQIMHLSQPQLDSVMRFIGFSKLSINDDTLSKELPEISIDFNAIAQGYSVDVVVDFLKSKGIKDAIVEVGGELAAIGENKLKNKNWIVGIDDPLQNPEEERKLIAKIKLKDLGMATSGNYRKVIIDTVTGEKYVHTMNPKTGKPQKGKLLSATILAADTMMADGLATAFMVMDVEQSIAYLNTHPELYAYLIYMDDNNEEQFFQTDNFKVLVVN